MEQSTRETRQESRISRRNIGRAFFHICAILFFVSIDIRTNVNIRITIHGILSHFLIVFFLFILLGVVLVLVLVIISRLIRCIASSLHSCIFYEGARAW